MDFITANELKTKGISAIKKIIDKQEIPVLTERGKEKFVVIDIEEYNKFREYQLDQALKEAYEEIKTGNYKEGIKEHLKDIISDV